MFAATQHKAHDRVNLNQCYGNTRSYEHDKTCHCSNWLH